jgi:hypothetical protein
MTNQGIVLEREREREKRYPTNHFQSRPKQAISIPNIEGKKDH